MIAPRHRVSVFQHGLMVDRMKAIQLLSTIAVGLIGATPSPAVSFAPRSFGYPSYAGAPFQEPVFGSFDYGDHRGRNESPPRRRRAVSR
jgi:hypothetical protein